MLFRCLQRHRHAHKTSKHEVDMWTVTPMKQLIININARVKTKSLASLSPRLSSLTEGGSETSGQSHGTRCSCRPAGLVWPLFAFPCSPSSQVHPLFAQNRFDTEVREKWVLHARLHVLPNMEHNLTSMVLTSTAGLKWKIMLKMFLCLSAWYQEPTYASYTLLPSVSCLWGFCVLVWGGSWEKCVNISIICSTCLLLWFVLYQVVTISLMGCCSLKVAVAWWS